MEKTLKEYLHHLPSGLRFPLESGDVCVILMPKPGSDFHEWHYYLLDGPAGLRVVRRHKILPAIFPTQEVLVTDELSKDPVVEHVIKDLDSGQLTAMGDCSR